MWYLQARSSAFAETRDPLPTWPHLSYKEREKHRGLSSSLHLPHAETAPGRLGMAGGWPAAATSRRAMAGRGCGAPWARAPPSRASARPLAAWGNLVASSRDGPVAAPMARWLRRRAELEKATGGGTASWRRKCHSQHEWRRTGGRGRAPARELGRRPWLWRQRALRMRAEPGRARRVERQRAGREEWES